MDVAFCLPGNQYSGAFLKSWSETLRYCHSHNINYYISQAQSNNIYYVRNLCLGLDVQRHKQQKPFDNRLNYESLIWIDSDILWTTQDFKKLLEIKEDVAGGLYLMENGAEYAAVQNWDEKFFKNNGHFEFLTPKHISKHPNKLLETDYIGFGFLKMSRRAVESLEYPHFRPVYFKIGDCVDFSGDDVSCCYNLREKGFKIYAHTGVVVKHLKLKAL